jgi:Flp pilus assembly pilin Flp
MWKRLWEDESGAIISAELALIMSILGIGMVAGASTLRDAVVTELADTGQAIGNMNQSFNVSNVNAASSATGASLFSDAFDFGDNGPGGSNSRGLVISSAGPINSTEGAAAGSSTSGS